MSSIKTDDIDTSPSENQFPFTFGDSPPQPPEAPPQLALGTMTGALQPSSGVDAQLIAYRTVSRALPHGRA